MKMLKNRDHREIYLVPIEDVKEFLIKCPEMRARIINYPTLDRYERKMSRLVVTTRDESFSEMAGRKCFK